ncbi:MAG TPA: hypothetical protein DCL01_12660 [Thauera sp.]|nr:hypothetical protein [Thauera sp.]HHW62444.1 hypothetical protein [Rhodocyclaceae bacterium]
MKRKDLQAQASRFISDHDLPETALDLIGLIGWERTQALIAELGGVPFPVPKRANNNAAGARRYLQLAEIVGRQAADVILRCYGDDVLNIPNCKTALRRARNRAIVSFYDDGATLEECALAFGVTTRWVSIVLKTVSPKAEGQQLRVQGDASPDGGFVPATCDGPGQSAEY